MYAILAICSRQIQSPAESPDQIRSLVDIALWCPELSFFLLAYPDLLNNLLDNIPLPAFPFFFCTCLWFELEILMQ